ncbi:uncharacterized protein PADG_03660 [Paracoccidioides brasiliensis Pb18]|uniref:Pyroglutamyl peptidase type I n=1 Tax=Paracoccidioides brasiliensis (strain Pb18) TaxID=502780 RepID=C1G8S4_PARBD|nr:uncharacterized protein PADG_03660 [Paracoccidioides brasiliensis Pb18]EEH47576.1 hypothetical protein PADG_03660 [Paracoccidioides brasiliensis Pb18]
MGDLGPLVSDELEQVPNPLTVTRDSVKDINVLVTGFGPFKTNAVNPSYLIASALPKTVTLPQASPTSPTCYARIHIHPEPIRVSYAAVRSAVPTIIESFKKDNDGRPPDLIIHIGMASTRECYTVETVAHRDGYNITDVDEQVGFKAGEALWKEAGLPAVLRPGPSTTSTNDGDESSAPRKSAATAVYTTRDISSTSTFITSTRGGTTTTLTTTTTSTTTTTARTKAPPLSSPSPDEQDQVQDQTQTLRNTITTTIASTAPKTPTSPSPPDARFLKTWRSFAPQTAELCLSDDAGRYLCEFIFYTSLAQAYMERRNRSVVFLHVPGRTDEAGIEIGRDVTVALVKCLVACWVD